MAVVRKKQIHGQLGQPFELTQPGLQQEFKGTHGNLMKVFVRI